jgi:hypothetical protein
MPTTIIGDWEPQKGRGYPSKKSNYGFNYVGGRGRDHSALLHGPMISICGRCMHRSELFIKKFYRKVRVVRVNTKTAKSNEIERRELNANPATRPPD